jgi:hypothetical protein
VPCWPPKGLFRKGMTLLVWFGLELNIAFGDVERLTVWLGLLEIMLPPWGAELFVFKFGLPLIGLSMTFLEKMLLEAFPGFYEFGPWVIVFFETRL